MTTSSSANILNAKKFLKKYSIQKYKPEGNSNIYLAAQTKSIGFFLLKKIFKIKKKNFFENLIYILKDISLGLNYSVKLIKPKKLKQNFSRIVLSWGNKKDFDNSGNFYDKYFNTQTSKKKKILWLIIYMDKNLPKKIQSNTILLKIKGNKILNIFNWMKFLIFNLPKIFKNFDYFLVNISSFNYLSKRIIFSLRTILIKNFKEIIIPYEGQPFQNEIIRFLKNKNDKVIVTGYIHSSPLSTPTNFIHKQFCPDRIFLNGKDQLFCFEKILNWPKKKLNYIPSLRFRKNKTKHEKKIFIPYVVRRHEEILSNLKYTHEKISNLNNYIIQNHPAAKNFNSNLNLIWNIKKIIQSKSKLKKKKNLYDLIFIGNSGGIAELLERGYSILHICEDEEFESYSDKIWKSIKTNKISKNIYSYKLKNKGNLINFGKNDTDLNSILDY